MPVDHHRVDQLVVGDRILTMYGPGVVSQLLTMVGREYGDILVAVELDDGSHLEELHFADAPSGKIGAFS